MKSKEIAILERSVAESSTSSTSGAQSVPHFAEGLQETYEVGEFSTHSFKCIVFGTPTPEVRWYHNDQLITISELVQYLQAYLQKENNSYLLNDITQFPFAYVTIIGQLTQFSFRKRVRRGFLQCFLKTTAPDNNRH